MNRLGPALDIRDFRRWWLAAIGMNVSLQMIDVAIGWQVYTQHHSTLYLGLIGLAEFVPLCLLALPAGIMADRLPRRTVFALALLGGAAVAAGLVLLNALDVTAVGAYLAVAFGAGVTMAIVTPAATAMPPTLVPPELLHSALTLRSIATRSAAVIGPALGGLLFAIRPQLAYAAACVICLAASLCVLTMHSGRVAVLSVDDPAAVPGLHGAVEGLRFVRRTPILLGAMLLDLLGVLFGGAVALLPVFASSILHVGPFGLGVLRAGPAVGALLAAARITRHPLRSAIGHKLLLSVALFGASIIVFGLSRSYVLSLLALAVGGFVDLYNMNIRSTISALATPERLRGRVGAAEMVFISASNELGAFESGVAASLVGAVPAVVGGGAITVLLALGWRWAFPTLARLDRPADIGAEARELAVA